MNKRFTFLSISFLLVVFGVFVSTAGAIPTADCFVSGAGSHIPPENFDINFSCASDQTVYFGACDNGFATDDTFQIVFDGNIVASNEVSGGNELINIGSGSANSGANTATFEVLSAPDNISTWAYAVSSSEAEVQNTMIAECGGGVIFAAASPSSCYSTVNVFTQDGAPSDGTLELHALYGNEGARVDEQIYKVWDISSGTQLNNDAVSNVPPRYLRLWWQPDGSTDWYMLTSQYYSGDGTLASEYGLGCSSSAPPSYHTAFSNAIPESDVCFDPLTGCQ